MLNKMRQNNENLINEMEEAFQKVLQNTSSNQDFRNKLEIIYNTDDFDSLSEEEKIKSLLRYSQPDEREEELERKSKELETMFEDFEKSIDELEIDIPDIELPEIDLDFIGDYIE